jgi:hypothetical protein
MLDIGVEQGDPYFATVASIHSSRRIHNRDSAARGQSTSRHHECHIAVGQRDRDARADRRSLAWLKFDGFRSGQVRTGITRMRVTRDSPRSEQYIHVVGHVMRVVQNAERQTSGGKSENGAVIYRERLWPAAWLFISTALVIPASLLVFLPINETAGIIIAIVLYAGCVASLLIASPLITVNSTEFVAGKARIPLSLVGTLTGFRGAEATQQRGPRLDARAWLLIRGWVDPVVRLEVLDVKDPTPYWIVSTRRPDELIAAIDSTRAHPENQPAER